MTTHVETPIRSDRLLKLKDVKERTALGSSSIYRRIEAGTFPRPRQLSPACVRWKESDIDNWIENLPLTGAQ